MKGIIYYAPTAQRAKHVSHSNVGAEHCSALIDQRDRLRFSGLDALGRKTTLSLRYVTSRKGVRESHLAEGGTACGGVGALRRRFVSDFIRRAQRCCCPYPTETCFQKGLSLCRNSRKACFAFKCLVRCITHSASGRFFALRFLSVLRSIRFTACSWLFNFRPGFGRAGRRGLRRTGSLLRLPRAGRGEPWYPNYRFS